MVNMLYQVIKESRSLGTRVPRMQDAKVSPSFVGMATPRSFNSESPHVFIQMERPEVDMASLRSYARMVTLASVIVEPLWCCAVGGPAVTIPRSRSRLPTAKLLLAGEEASPS